MSTMMANSFPFPMTPDSPVSPDRNRRDFVKKSLAASIIAAQPTILAGLIRAQGGGGGETTASPWETTVDSTDWGTTYDTTSWDTTNWETTTIETTQNHTPKEWVRRLYAQFDSSDPPPSVDNSQSDLAQRSGKIYSGTLYCLLVKCNGDMRTVGYPIESGGYCLSNYLDRSLGSDASIPPGTWKVSRNSQIQNNPQGDFDIPSGHYINVTIRNNGRDAILVHGPIRDPGTSGCIAITDATLFSKWSQLMRKPRCSATSACSEVDYPSSVELVVCYECDGPNWVWKPMSEVPAPHNNPNTRPSPYPPQYPEPARLGLPVPVTAGGDEP